MKKLFAIVITLLFALGIVSAMADGMTFTTKYYTLELPEGWDTDTSDLQHDAENNAEDLGLFGQVEGEGLLCESYLIYYEDLKNIALWNSDADELKEYAEAVMEDFEDDHPVYLDTVKAGNIPFVLIRATDEDGDYLYADTITNGYSIVFIVTVIDEDGETILPMTDKYIEEFKTILGTFKPAA